MNIKHLLLIALLVFFSGGSFCLAQKTNQKAKVIKVKGLQAIVQFPKGSEPEPGQIIDLGGGGDGGDGHETSADFGGSGRIAGSTGPRHHLLGVSGVFGALNTSISGGGSSTNTTLFNVEGRYGWNAGEMEYGPLAAIAYTSAAGSSVTALSGGGFFDYNFVPNTVVNEFVYGIGGEASFGRSTPSTGTSSTVMGFDAGGFGKWFILGTPTALRTDLVFRYSQTTTGSLTSTTSGVLAKIGLSTYF